MLTLSKFLKSSKTSFKSLETAKKNEEIARERVVYIEKFQDDLDIMVEKIKNIIKSKNFEIQNIKVYESDAYDFPHEPEITATIKIVFADTFDDEFFEMFDKTIEKTLESKYKVMTLDDNYQKTITIDVKLKLKKLLSMEM